MRIKPLTDKKSHQRTLTGGQLDGRRHDGAADGLLGVGHGDALVVDGAADGRGPVAGLGTAAADDGVAGPVAQGRARAAGAGEGAAHAALGLRLAEEVRAAVLAAQHALLAGRAGVPGESRVESSTYEAMDGCDLGDWGTRGKRDGQGRLSISFVRWIEIFMGQFESIAMVEDMI